MIIFFISLSQNGKQHYGLLDLFQFLIYDTQMIMGGRKIELSPEEYIYGALQLYIDVVYIFLFLLSLMGKSN